MLSIPFPWEKMEMEIFHSMHHGKWKFHSRIFARFADVAEMAHTIVPSSILAQNHDPR
jgi:hypothetical protein